MEKPGQPSKVGQTVPLSELIAAKDKIKKLLSDLESERKVRADVEAQLKVAKVNGEDDEEIKKVRQGLLDEWDKLKADKDKLDEDSTSFKEREKIFTVSQLASKYGVEVDAISDKDDPEKEALKLYAEKLTKEKEVPKPGVYDASSPAVARVDISKINVATPEGRKQFADIEAQMKEEALSKK